MTAKKLSIGILVLLFILWIGTAHWLTLARTGDPNQGSLSIKGGEVESLNQWATYQVPIQGLNLAWARIHLKWSEIELNDGSYDFSKPEYIDFRNAITIAQGMQLNIIITVKNVPLVLKESTPVATDPNGNPTPWPTLCGRMALPAGAERLKLFIVAILNRLRSDMGLGVHDPLPVQYIELWNEPDTKAYQGFPGFYGCWIRSAAAGTATPSEAYEGGVYYAQVLNEIAPYVKQYFPTIKFVAGAVTHADSAFLDGILDHALPNIDVVSYHQYVFVNGLNCDPSLYISIHEEAFRHVRNDLIVRNATEKYILISEGAMRYTTWGLPTVSAGTPAPTASSAFYECQARFAAHLLSWANVKSQTGQFLGFIWYTVGVNGWGNTDLLFPNATPKPVYHVWKEWGPHIYLPLLRHDPPQPGLPPN